MRVFMGRREYPHATIGDQRPNSPALLHGTSGTKRRFSCPVEDRVPAARSYFAPTGRHSYGRPPRPALRPSACAVPWASLLMALRAETANSRQGCSPLRPTLESLERAARPGRCATKQHLHTLPLVLAPNGAFGNSHGRSDSVARGNVRFRPEPVRAIEPLGT